MASDLLRVVDVDKTDAGAFTESCEFLSKCIYGAMRGSLHKRVEAELGVVRKVWEQLEHRQFLALYAHLDKNA